MHVRRLAVALLAAVACATIGPASAAWPLIPAYTVTSLASVVASSPTVRR